MKREIIDVSQLELVDQVVDIKRVTKVVKGGRNMRFTALVVVGDKNGHVAAARPPGTGPSSKPDSRHITLPMCSRVEPIAVGI